jgi:hypothetical protein
VKLVSNTLTTSPHVGLAWKCRKPQTWAFDFEAIAEAARELGIERPIVVGIVEAGGRTQTTHGAHRVKTMIHDGTTGPVHSVTVRRTCTAEQASQTLWHELAHAMQAERHGDPHTFYAAYAREGGAGSYGTAYERNPYEVEARSFEANAERLALVKALAA